MPNTRSAHAVRPERAPDCGPTMEPGDDLKERERTVFCDALRHD